MTTITTTDLSVRLADVLAGLAVGEEFLVMDHGRPVARIVPPDSAGRSPNESADEWVARWYAWTDNHPKRDLVIDDSRAAIYSGCGE